MGDRPEGVGLERELTGTWFRSFEEELGSDLVFRPPGFGFPPSRRPRPALKLQPDGTAVALRGGPADRPEPVRPQPARAEGARGEGGTPGGGWWSVRDSTLTLDTPDLAGTFTVQAAGGDRLVVRPAPNPGDDVSTQVPAAP